MVFTDPVHGIRKQEALDFWPSVIEQVSPPHGMDSLPRIQMFIQAGSVKCSQIHGIRRKLRRRPVKNYAYAMLMKLINQAFQAERVTKAERRSKIARRMEPSGALIRKLHHRRQFHMSIAHLDRMSREQLGCLADILPLCPVPRKEVRRAFHDGKRTGSTVSLRAAAFHIVSVMPVVFQGSDHRYGLSLLK